jgi:hypothetical protein
LLRRLVAAGIDFVVIGGVAVGAHGVVRGTKDLDLCPSPSRENLGRLASLLRDLGVSQVGVDDQEFSAREMPFDATRAEDLANLAAAHPEAGDSHPEAQA